MRAYQDPRKALRGLSRPRYWSRYLVLGTILWVFVVNSLQNLPKLTSGWSSKVLAWFWYTPRLSKYLLKSFKAFRIFKSGWSSDLLQVPRKSDMKYVEGREEVLLHVPRWYVDYAAFIKIRLPRRNCLPPSTLKPETRDTKTRERIRTGCKRRRGATPPSSKLTARLVTYYWFTTNLLGTKLLLTY